MRSTVRDILKHKDGEMLEVPITASAALAAELMRVHQVGSLVVQEQGRVVGLITERDLLHGLIRLREDPGKILVRVFYDPKRIHVGLDAETGECMALMTRHRHRYLLVEEGNEILGIVSIGDVVKRMLMDGQQEVQDLASYISGVYASWSEPPPPPPDYAEDEGV